MIVEKILEAKKAKIKQWPVRSNRASELGHQCLRYLVLNRTRWSEKTIHTAELQLIFDQGRANEKLVNQDLTEAGFVIVEQQRPFSWDKYDITGAIDMKLALYLKFLEAVQSNGACPPQILQRLLADCDEFKGAVVPTEIKSAAPHPFESINSVQDMFNHKYAYMRRYPAQLTLYLIMDGKEIGLFLFKNKSSGMVKEIWMQHDYEFAESLVQKAEAINKHVAEGTLPEPIEYDDMICGGCGYAHICMPDRIGTEVEVVSDEELLGLVTRYMELKPLSKEYDDVDDRITKLVEGREKILIGDYFITGKYQTRKVYHVPDDIRNQYVAESQSWRKKIAKV